MVRSFLVVLGLLLAVLTANSNAELEVFDGERFADFMANTGAPDVLSRIIKDGKNLARKQGYTWEPHIPLDAFTHEEKGIFSDISAKLDEYIRSPPLTLRRDPVIPEKYWNLLVDQLKARRLVHDTEDPNYLSDLPSSPETPQSPYLRRWRLSPSLADFPRPPKGWIKKKRSSRYKAFFKWFFGF